MAPAGNKSLRLSRASHVKYIYLPTYLLHRGKHQEIESLVIARMDFNYYFLVDEAIQQTAEINGHVPKTMASIALFKFGLRALSNIIF